MLEDKSVIIDLLDPELTLTYDPITLVSSITNNNEYYNLLNFSDNFLINTLSVFSSAEFFTALFIFNFLQLLILSTLSELIWPTQLFNRQHTIAFTAFRLRTYTEVFAKLYNYTSFYKLYNNVLRKQY